MCVLYGGDVVLDVDGVDVVGEVVEGVDATEEQGQVRGGQGRGVGRGEGGEEVGLGGVVEERQEVLCLDHHMNIPLYEPTQEQPIPLHLFQHLPHLPHIPLLILPQLKLLHNRFVHPMWLNHKRDDLLLDEGLELDNVADAEEVRRKQVVEGQGGEKRERE